LKVLKYLFLVIFLTLLFTPLIFFNWKGITSEIEKRNLATFPLLFNGQSINVAIFQQMDDFLKDRFGFRERLIQLNANMKYKMLHDSGNDRAILGKNQWLYYIYKSDGDNYSDFMKNNLVDENIKMNFANQIKYRADWCKKNNIVFIFLFAPNKHSVYPENYPIKRPQGMTRADQLLSYLDEEGIEYVYPRDLLITKKSQTIPLFFETDTHWNQQAAYYVYKLLINKLEEKLPKVKFPYIDYEINVSTTSGSGYINPIFGLKSHGGDIPPMLGLQSFGKTTIVQYKPKGMNWTDMYHYTKNEGNEGIITEIKGQSLPTAMIFRDSFFMALQPFTSTLFSKAEYLGKFFEDSDQAYILENKPDVIIWEVVERHTNHILSLSWNN
jgi:alginate O-acetyltransferase complex protein AlgJ